jgi:hypothetical protein
VRPPHLKGKPSDERTEGLSQEVLMSASSDQRAVKRRNKDRSDTLSAKLKEQMTDWVLADDQLDEALRQTFPASDAVSIVQSSRRT